ncbi:MAG: V-type ATP synthase subunit D [Candidatus Undinarchaeales archaeon]
MAKTLSVNPTRMELLKLGKKIKLTTKGHKLLKEKLDALIMRFMKLIDKQSELREEVEDYFEEAFNALMRAQAVSGTLDVRSAALAVKEMPDVKVEQKNIMGVKLPKLEVQEEKRDMSNRGYGPLQTSVAIDEAAGKYERAIKLVIELAELESSVQLLGKEIEKTKRRVNALEYIMIPRLKATKKFISMRLDELEREDLFRLKKIKARIEEKKK